ncbi:hypothetical protein C2L65_41840 [Paraburkholderia terrae]|uniref:Uncharacterized protein n=1 Tax=Paraburkholderia terrae TaxID=311230 RepID=A0A2I8F332_9BURK|nr:hypothetical protein C2L65_41840 [Paraburkholderia terrae]
MRGTKLSVFRKHIAAKLSARHHQMRTTVLVKIAGEAQFDILCPSFGLCDVARYALSYKAVLCTSVARYRLLFSKK